MLERELSKRVIGAFFDVYNHFGFGLPEVVYARALEMELTARGMLCAREAPIEVSYRGSLVGELRADMIVESRIILELKATPQLHPHDQFQLLNYLRAAGISVGLLLHFGRAPAFRRVVSSH